MRVMNLNKYRMEEESGNVEDIPPQFPDNISDISDMERDVENATEELERIGAQEAFTAAYLEYGDDLGLNAYGLRMGYLSTSAMAVYGLEALNEDSIVIAQENLISSIKDKITGWLAKLIPTLEKTGKVISEFVSKQLSKIVTLASTAMATTKKTVKTHPFATILTAITACAGVTAVAPAMMRLIPTLASSLGRAGMAKAATGAAGAAASSAPAAAESAAAATSIIARIRALVARIKWPFGKFNVVEKGKGFALEIEETAVETVSGSPEKLGWTKTAVQSVKNKLGSLKNLAPNLTEMAKTQYTAEVTEISGLWKNKNYLKLAGSLGIKALVYVPFLTLGWEVVVAAFKLVKEVIWGTFRVVGHALAALTGRSEKKDLAQGGTANASA